MLLVNIMSSSSEMPVTSIFATDDEGTHIRKKREHSPDLQTGDQQSLDIRKAYARVFRPVKSTLSMLFKQNSDSNQRKRLSRRIALISLRFVPSVSVFI